jgi:hypothetical protein
MGWSVGQIVNQNMAVSHGAVLEHQKAGRAARQELNVAEAVARIQADDDHLRELAAAVQGRR